MTFTSLNTPLSLCDKAALWTQTVHVTNNCNIKRNNFLVIRHAVNFETLLMFLTSCSLLMLWTERFFTRDLTVRVYNAKLCFLVTVCGKAVFFIRTLCVSAPV